VCAWGSELHHERSAVGCCASGPERAGTVEPSGVHSVDPDAVVIVVDDAADAVDESKQVSVGAHDLEDGFLDPQAVAFAELGDLPEPTAAFGRGGVDVVSGDSPHDPAAGGTGLRAGWAPALPSPPGCHQAGWHLFAAAGFACGRVTERNGSSARQRSQIRRSVRQRMSAVPVVAAVHMERSVHRGVACLPGSCGSMWAVGCGGRCSGADVDGGVEAARTSAVRYWYDLTCPFCYVGQARTAVLRRNGLTVVELPLQLHPEIPAEGVLSFPRRGPMCEVLEAEARDAQLKLRWPDRQPNSLLALMAAEWTRTHHPQSFRKVVESLFAAYFAEGRDIGAQIVIDDYVAAAGAEVGALHAALADGAAVAAIDSARRQAMAAGVIAIPAWLATGWSIRGLHPREVFEEKRTP
jgi:predicted DsbA family dithiol-disulfide isomerase